MKNNKVKLIFPDLDFILKHPRVYKGIYQDYKFPIFRIGNSYCRIVYNENNNGRLYLDMMQCGYCDQWTAFGHESISYSATKSGYKELKEKCEEVYNELILELLNSNKEYSELWK